MWFLIIDGSPSFPQTLHDNIFALVGPKSQHQWSSPDMSVQRLCLDRDPHYPHYGYFEWHLCKATLALFATLSYFLFSQGFPLNFRLFESYQLSKKSQGSPSKHFPPRVSMVEEIHHYHKVVIQHTSHIQQGMLVLVSLEKVQEEWTRWDENQFVNLLAILGDQGHISEVFVREQSLHFAGNHYAANEVFPLISAFCHLMLHWM